jgi:N-acetylmuramic acid 6-phosphate (MurNAc-6-P) etherase
MAMVVSLRLQRHEQGERRDALNQSKSVMHNIRITKGSILVCIAATTDTPDTVVESLTPGVHATI